MTKLTSPAELNDLCRAFKALANPNRLAMYMELLRQREHSVRSCALHDLVDLIDIGAPTVSHHTKELASAGLIEVERHGKYIRCRLRDDTRARLVELLSSES